MRRAGLGKERAGVRSSALEPAVPGAGAREEVGPSYVPGIWAGEQDEWGGLWRRCQVDTGHLSQVLRGFLKLGPAPSLNGRFGERSGGRGGGVATGASSAAKSFGVRDRRHPQRLASASSLLALEVKCPQKPSLTECCMRSTL